MSGRPSNKRRERGGDDDQTKATRAGEQLAPGQKRREDAEGDLVFEDPFEDEVEDDEEVEANKNQQKTNGQIDEEDDEDEDMDANSDEDEEKVGNAQQRLFRAGVDELAEDEELEYDSSAYIMLHQLHMEWPCLSFDFLRDGLGADRVKLPASMLMVAGTQADETRNNRLLILKLSDMHRTRKDRLDEDDDDDDDDDEDDDLDDDPIVDSRFVKHPGAVNRVRSMPQHPNIVSTWSDAGRVYMWDIAPQLRSMRMTVPGMASDAGAAKANAPPTANGAIFAFKGHKDEGYALDWSSVHEGRMASGDCHRDIFLWQVQPDGTCVVDSTPLPGHTDSVEDLQWSPVEPTVLASGSVDLSVRIWDVRERSRAMVTLADAHTKDVNVLSWNKRVPYLLASGSDDGSFKVWDLRMLKPNKAQGGLATKPEPVGFFQWHKAPITSLEWHPHDETVIAAAGADNQVSIWDFSLEEDPEQASSAAKLQGEVIGADGAKIDIPPQLLFLHQGQSDPKEIHFHPQVPGLIGSTALDGFHAFICEPLDPKGIFNKYLVPDNAESSAASSSK